MIKNTKIRRKNLKKILKNAARAKLSYRILKFFILIIHSAVRARYASE